MLRMLFLRWLLLVVWQRWIARGKTWHRGDSDRLYADAEELHHIRFVLLLGKLHYLEQRRPEAWRRRLVPNGRCSTPRNESNHRSTHTVFLHTRGRNRCRQRVHHDSWRQVLLPNIWHILTPQPCKSFSEVIWTHAHGLTSKTFFRISLRLSQKQGRPYHLIRPAYFHC